MTNKQGVLIGQFSVLHLGHLADINQAAGMVDVLHIIITNHTSLSPKKPTLQDKVRWLQNACQVFDFVKIHTLASLGLSHHTADYHTYQSHDKSLLDTICQKLAPDNPLIFSKHTLVFNDYSSAILPKTTQDDLDIAQYPLRYFHHLALPCRYFFALKVCIVGGESSGKTTLIHKLANEYAANVALEMGRVYTHSHLGGTELALQYSDYPTIASHHAAAIEAAATHTASPVVLIDTDFVTTQAFCATYEHRPHPMLDAWIADYHPNSSNPYRMDCTIYLDNNVTWVADGMRRLGGSQRSQFAQSLLDLYQKHAIALHHIDNPDYHERYLTAKAIIDSHLY